MKKLFISFAVALSVFTIASAQIVYTDLTSNPVVLGGSGEMYYDLNLMGDNVFMIQNYAVEGEYIYFASAMPGAAVVSTASSYNANVVAMAKNTNVVEQIFYGYDNQGSVYFNILASPDGSVAYGRDFTGEGPYVGFKFKKNNNTYYGWAKLSVNYASSYEATTVTLYGYAYQSTPNTFILTGDTGSGSTSGLNDVESHSFSVYPNPVTNCLNIKGDNIQSVSVYNLNGQEMMKVTDGTNKIEVANLERGMYILSIVSENGVSKHKFIKE